MHFTTLRPSDSKKSTDIKVNLNSNTDLSKMDTYGPTLEKYFVSIICGNYGDSMEIVSRQYGDIMESDTFDGGNSLW